MLYYCCPVTPPLWKLCHYRHCPYRQLLYTSCLRPNVSVSLPLICLSSPSKYFLLYKSWFCNQSKHKSAFNSQHWEGIWLIEPYVTATIKCQQIFDFLKYFVVRHFSIIILLFLSPVSNIVLQLFIAFKNMANPWHIFQHFNFLKTRTNQISETKNCSEF